MAEAATNTTSTKPVPSSLDSYVGQIGNIGTDLDTLGKQHAAAAAPLQQQYQATLRQPVQQPNLISPPQRPHQATNVDIMQGMGSPMAILAIFGSLLTRRPMVSALNAASAAMMGYAQGNREAYDRAEQAWHDSVQEALQQNQVEIERYRAAIDAHANDVNAALAAVQAEASQFHDQVMMAQAKAGLIGDAVQIVQARQRQSEAAQNHLDMMQLRRDQMDLAQRKQDELQADRAIKNDIAKEKMGLLKAKSTDTVKAKATDLQSLSDDLETTINAVEIDPTLAGGRGMIRRGAGETVGQLPYMQWLQDPEGEKFKSDIETLQARLTKPFLQAHYFTGNSAEEMDQLVRGLNWRDDPTSTITSLQKVKSIIDAQIGTIAGATQDVQDRSFDLGTGGPVIQNGWIYQPDASGQYQPVGPAP